MESYKKLINLEDYTEEVYYLWDYDSKRKIYDILVIDIIFNINTNVLRYNEKIYGKL